jgi:hypothetical protein
MIHAVDILLIFTQLMRSDLSEHYCCVQKGIKNHIRVIWTHKLFSNCPNLQIILRYLLCLMPIVNEHLSYFFSLHDGIRLLMEKWPQIGVTLKDR